MQVATEPSAPTTASGASIEPSAIMDGRRHGYHWVVIMVAASAFRFRVYDADDEHVFVDADDYPHAGKAATAAEKWCEQEHAATGGNSEPASERPASDPAHSTFSVTTVAGWMLQPVDDRGGTCKVEVVNAATGEYGPEEFKGYVAWGDALADAVAWAKANPCDGSAPEPEVAGEASPTPAGEPEWGEPAEAVEHEPAVAAAADACTTATEAPAVDADTEVLELRRQLAEKNRQIDAMAADLTEAGVQADEASALAVEIVELESQVKVLKDELKAKKGRLDLINGKMARHVRAVSKGATPPAYQLTFVGDPATAADAEQVAAQLPGTVVWPFNGVEHTIDITAQGEGRFRAVFREHPEVEGFGETAAQALEHAKADASIRFEGTDPGSTDKMPDAGPVADGPRRTKRKGPFEGKTTAQVIAVVRGSKDVAEAIEKLECTAPQLKKFLKAEGVTVSDHLAKDTELPEPKVSKVSAKGRGKRGR